MAVLFFGWFLFLAMDYRQLSKHVAGATTFTSNFLFWRESGYFDNASETKPLLHLWSLAIEEQFYLVWPLIINFIKLQTVKLGLIVLFFIFIVLKIGYDTLPISSIYESYRLTIPGAFPVILGCFVAFVFFCYC
jgi:peptidoglycan/LPS O-acetylase OafA/YrhL